MGDERATREPANSHSPRFRAHHGSISLDERRATEEALKQGELAAVVATASLELGIDMGAVDLVCQVESPGNVARGLQRVGRAGHVVHGISRGRLIAKTPADLLESAALCRAMLDGRDRALARAAGLPRRPGAAGDRLRGDGAVGRPGAFDLVRCAYPFHDLSAEAFESVLRLVSGRFPSPGLRDLRARVAWDRIHNRLAALPGTAHLALVGGGTIPDTGQFPVYLGDGGPRLGELDEEFVYERRVGETFMLGNAAWRIDAIEPHRVVVSRAEGQPAVMPFWHGEAASCSPELGEAVGRSAARSPAGWMIPNSCRGSSASAGSSRRPRGCSRGSSAASSGWAGAMPDDRTILIEAFLDQAGELGLAVLTPFGGKLHHGLKLALLARIRRRLGVTPACLHVDDGLLFRLPNLDEPPLDLFDGLTGELAEELIREELPETALFGLRFRQNAGRALLMPRPDPAKRTPLWLQRLRAKDLLQVARQFPDFPIVLETVRECLDDDLDLPRLRGFLDAIQAGSIRVVRRQGEVPSPLTSELIFGFTAAHLYAWDEPKRSDRKPARRRGRRGPARLRCSATGCPRIRLAGSPGDRPRRQPPPAVGAPPAHRGRDGRTPAPARRPDRAELAGPMAASWPSCNNPAGPWSIELPGTAEPRRWIAAEDLPLYRAAFPGSGRAGPIDVTPDSRSRSTIVERFLRTHALIGLADLTARYPIEPGEAAELLERWAERGQGGPAGRSG